MWPNLTQQYDVIVVFQETKNSKNEGSSQKQVRLNNS